MGSGELTPDGAVPTGDGEVVIGSGVIGEGAIVVDICFLARDLALGFGCDSVGFSGSGGLASDAAVAGSGRGASFDMGPWEDFWFFLCNFALGLGCDWDSSMACSRLSSPLLSSLPLTFAFLVLVP